MPGVQSEARPAKQRFQVAAAVESAGNLGGELSLFETEHGTFLRSDPVCCDRFGGPA